MTSLDLTEFDFDIPEDLIAQTPPSKRGESKLLHVNRSNESVNHTTFSSFVELLPSNSMLVLNNTKVIKARVKTYRKSGGKIECLFLERLKKNTWNVLIRNSKRLTIGEKLMVKNQELEIIEITDKHGIVKINGTLSDYEFLESFGEAPLPPYIKSEDPNQHFDRYQSIFAASPGAVAAPTASLHFTEDTFAQLKLKNIDITYITLHIGLGTFNPIQSKNIYDHIMHKEKYIIDERSAKNLNSALQNNKKLIAVGTTVTRCLESNYQNGKFYAGQFDTNLYITPKYNFKCIDGMLTNFHLPKSSLFILIASFIGKETALKIYHSAVKKNYRFFSFGDAMLIT